MLSDQVHRLKPHQLKELEQTMFEAGVAAELGYDYKEIFRRAAIGRIGLMRRIYRAMYKATEADMAKMADILLDGRA